MTVEPGQEPEGLPDFGDEEGEMDDVIAAPSPTPPCLRTTGVSPMTLRDEVEADLLDRFKMTMKCQETVDTVMFVLDYHCVWGAK